MANWSKIATSSLALACALASPAMAFHGGGLSIQLKEPRTQLRVLSSKTQPIVCQLPEKFARRLNTYGVKPKRNAAPQASKSFFSGIDDINLARATMLGVAAMYGTNFGSVKILEEAMPASVAAATRFTLASLVLLPLLKGMKKDVVFPSVQIGLLTAAGYYAQGISLTSGGADASTAAFLCSLAVVVCPLLDLVKGTRAFGQREAKAVGLAVAGTAILELGGSMPGTGDLWALVQPLAFGTAFWKVEQLMHKFPQQANAITAVQVGTVGIFSILWALFDTTGSGGAGLSSTAASLLENLQSDGRLLPALVWTSCFTTALTVWLETKALGKLSSAETTLLFSTEPLWGTAFAFIALGEHIGANTLIGGALILVACLSPFSTPSSSAPPQRSTSPDAAADEATSASHLSLTKASAQPYTLSVMKR